MKNKHDELLDRLFLILRSEKPDTATIEEHFETRLMARLEEQRISQAFWSVWTWRLMPWFVTIVVIIGIGSVIYDPTRSSDLFSTFNNGYEEYVTTSLLTGG